MHDCPGELKDQGLGPHGDVQKRQCVQEESQEEEIRQEFTRSRNLELEKKHRASYLQLLEIRGNNRFSQEMETQVILGDCQLKA